MKRFQTQLIYFLLLLPFISFCQTNSDCNDVTTSSATVNGSYTVDFYLESDGIRDGNDYYGSTIYYPENTSGLLPSIIIIPGYANPELSIQSWGSFLASHGIVCMTIGTNSIWDEVIDRKIALKDALISLKDENSRTNSPLFNSLDTNLIALGGWSMGGGGAQLVAAEDPSIKAILAFCPWIDPSVVSPSMLNHSSPILIFSGQIDVVAPPVTHADIQYNYTPSSTKKLKYEVFGGGHTIANTPLGGFGEVGRMGLSWLKKHLVNDSCYCPLLLDIPTTASYYETNIDCSTPNSVVDYINDLIVYPNPASSTITLKRMLIKNNIYKIVSIDGRVLKSELLTSSKIDVSFLKNGIYFLDYRNQKMKLIKH
ncbi:T9SS type A sorting domain-containing protein [Flavobacteriales bacterium]|nr:T9SS type A sorting domain-containing protein [Flavobacteriales bacterium]